jgi:hypothetical protein
VREHDDVALRDGAPRLFGIVADPATDDDELPRVVAWGHELPDHAVLTWSLHSGSEVAVFRSAEAALATAQLLFPARLLWPASP